MTAWTGISESQHETIDHTGLTGIGGSNPIGSALSTLFTLSATTVSNHVYTAIAWQASTNDILDFTSTTIPTFKNNGFYSVIIELDPQSDTTLGFQCKFTFGSTGPFIKDVAEITNTTGSYSDITSGSFMAFEGTTLKIEVWHSSGSDRSISGKVYVTYIPTS